MTEVKNLPCPQCNSALVTDGRAWVECACGYRHGVFVRSNGDGTFSVKLRTGGRPPVTRKKMPVNGRMYDDDLWTIEAHGYTVQRLLDEAVERVKATERVLAFCECKLPGESVTKPKICPICEKPRGVTEG